ncbi:hypothetical protein Q2T42_30520 [Leptolyngbya boryana CZ1]|uniref:Uncharacterized protein n=1 Tax=Leptolyngbya boryana CZ1 TaxID=3060204 RepID=A0AA96WUA0_LEPBY|nr:hypothetical protein [Leptolyngbya boryana]WNZ46126.1 hypothetical protein Q2T42_30520 [Leptolyngbya boryana CZ1]
MAGQQDFPLQEFNSGLNDIQAFLERAERETSKGNGDQELTTSIREAKEAASNLQENLKSGK